MVTLGARMGNPTEPMAQGLLNLLPSKMQNKICIFFMSKHCRKMSKIVLIFL